MKNLLFAFCLFSLLENSFACPCPPKPNEFFDFIALVTICNNEYFGTSYSAHVALHQTEFEILELFKGPELTHILNAAYYSEHEPFPCEIKFEPNSEWIIFGKYSVIDNDFKTDYCSGNIHLYPCANQID